MSTSILTETRRECRIERARPLDTPVRSEITPAVYFRWKRILDLVSALVLLVPALPLIGVMVLVVRLTSRGPGIYAKVVDAQQGGERVGVHRFLLRHLFTSRDEHAQGLTYPVVSARAAKLVVVEGARRGCDGLRINRI